MSEIFTNVPVIKYEGPNSTNPFSFKYYDPERVVLGKKMKDQLPFAMAWWHNLGANGVDMFGRGTADKSFGAKEGTMEHAKAKVDAGIEFMKKLGIKYYCFHDVDLVPEADDINETNRRLDEISDYILEKTKGTDIQCLWGTANMFSNPRFMNGAGSHLLFIDMTGAKRYSYIDSTKYNNKEIYMKREVSFSDIKKFDASFDKNPVNAVAMNAVVANGINAAAKNAACEGKNRYCFSIEVEAGKVCNQKQSGRCWMFASYNVMRLEIMKKLNLENMELSQTYPLFYDKLEKSNHFLECMLDTIDEPVDGRVVSFLLHDPVGDGGQWDMFRSLVKKYGVVPKEVMPETNVSSATRELDNYLTKKLREFACTFRKEYAKGKSVADLRKLKDEMMDTIYRMLVISLGKPPVKFDWEVRDKDKKFISEKGITPVEFFEKYVGWNLDDYVTVINAPTKDKPYKKTYTVKYLGNVENGAYPVKYLNLPMDDLRKLTIKQLKDDKAVWFGSDVGQFSERKGGFLTSDALDVDKLFSTEFTMTKEERLDFGESLMTHAMVITGVDLDKDGKPIRWKVENSWGDEVGDKGFFVMDDKWFGEFAYQILLNKKYLSAEQKKLFEQKPIVLEPWDPMGSLAK